MKHLRAIVICLACCFGAMAAEVIPPVPAQYFNDYAQVVSPSVALQLNQTLENFERDTSDQIIVAIFPKMQSDSSIEDYTIRVAREWRVGQKVRNNGAVLFVFVQDHKMFLQVGYGLEGALPDAICKRIIDEQIAPRFKTGDFDGGVTAGVQGIMAATKGEYKGTGSTVANSRGGGSHSSGGGLIPIIVILGFFILLTMARPRRRGWFYTGGGWYGGGWSSGGSSGGRGAGSPEVGEASGAEEPEGAGDYARARFSKSTSPRGHCRGDSRGGTPDLRRNPCFHQPQNGG